MLPSILGGLPRGDGTYILIIYQNYIVPNLVEYILKISLRSVYNCKSVKGSKDFSKKARTDFSLKNLQKY